MSLSLILGFLVVLGVLVFVHELGHFVAAKACNIYVDRFSLGMPPRLFGFKIGETDYCVGLLPIGGYVKMAGQEDAPLSDEEREETYGHVTPDRFFNNKKIWQRAIVLFAGPLMNLVLAYVLFGFLAAYGREVPLAELDTRVGAIMEDAPAADAPLWVLDGEEVTTGEPDAVGWKTGDRIVSINNKPMTRFEEIAIAAVLGKNEETPVEIERTLPDGTTQRYLSKITPRVIDKKLDHAQFGIAPYSTALVQHVLPDSPAAKNGLQAGDVILTANGELIDQQSFSLMVQEMEPGTTIDLTVDRNGEELNLTLVTEERGRISDIAFDPRLAPEILIPDDEAPTVPESDIEWLKEKGIRSNMVVASFAGETEVGSTLRRLLKESPDAAVDTVFKKGDETVTVSLTPGELLDALSGGILAEKPKIAGISDEAAEVTGLQRKDTIVEIEGEPATIEKLTEIQHTRIGETIPITVERPAMLWGIAQKGETFETELTIASTQQIGVVWGTKTVMHREAPADVIPAAIKEGNKQIAQIGHILGELFTGGLSPKNLGGPVMIAQVTTMAWQFGVLQVVWITAIISINLAIFNLLPLPVLDGGQLMFLLIEAVRRRPVSIRVMETVQQVGFLFIIGLLLFVTWNDVSRIVTGWLP